MKKPRGIAPGALRETVRSICSGPSQVGSLMKIKDPELMLGVLLVLIGAGCLLVRYRRFSPVKPVVQTNFDHLDLIFDCCVDTKGLIKGGNVT